MLIGMCNIWLFVNLGFAQSGNLDAAPDFKDTIARMVVRRDAVQQWDYSYHFKEFNRVKPSKRSSMQLSTGEQPDLSDLDDFWLDEDRRITEVRGRVFGSNEHGIYMHTAVLVSKGELYRNRDLPVFVGLRLTNDNVVELLPPELAIEKGLDLHPVAFFGITPEAGYAAGFESQLISRTSPGAIKASSLSIADFRALGLLFPGDYARHSTLEEVASNYMGWPEGAVKGDREGNILSYGGAVRMAIDTDKGLWPIKTEVFSSKVVEGSVKKSLAMRSEVEVVKVNGLFVPHSFAMSNDELSRRIDYEWHSVNKDLEPKDIDLEKFMTVTQKPSL